MTFEEKKEMRDKQVRFKKLIRNLRLAEEARKVKRPDGHPDGNDYVLRRAKERETLQSK